MRRSVIVLMSVLFTVASCPKSDSGTEVPSSTSTPPKVQTPVPEPVALDPVGRGNEIYFGTDYSNTGLTCAHCHAPSAADDANRIYIAHSCYGAVPRGAWKITSQEQLVAGKGNVATIVDAANICVKAAYMAHGEQLIEGDDAESLNAYLASIADPMAPDAKAFVIETSRSVPAAGLSPDVAHGQEIYSQSCSHCHGAGIEGMPELTGASEWLNPLQVMAKIRKVKGDWFNDYADQEYASAPAWQERLLALMAVAIAHAQENPCGENPCAENPCGEEPEPEADEVFAKGAMPFYASDILSDQDVVDVAHYVANKL